MCFKTARSTNFNVLKALKDKRNAIKLYLVSLTKSVGDLAPLDTSFLKNDKEQ